MAETKLNFKPIGGFILISPAKAEEKTKSGLYIPDTASEKPQQGQVVALGTGKLDANGKLLNFNVKVGDKVFFKKYSPTEITIESEVYYVLDEEAILGILI